MRIYRAEWIAVASLVLAAASVNAHHDLGTQFDSRKSITLTGTLTEVTWANPHVMMHMDGKARPSDTAMDWKVELASPNLLVLGGIKMQSLRPGDHITVTAYPARDGSNFVYGRKVTRSAH